MEEAKTVEVEKAVRNRTGGKLKSVKRGTCVIICKLF